MRRGGYDLTGACERCQHGVMFHGHDEHGACERAGCACARFRTTPLRPEPAGEASDA